MNESSSNPSTDERVSRRRISCSLHIFIFKPFVMRLHSRGRLNTYQLLITKNIFVWPRTSSLFRSIQIHLPLSCDPLCVTGERADLKYAKCKVEHRLSLRYVVQQQRVKLLDISPYDRRNKLPSMWVLSQKWTFLLRVIIVVLLIRRSSLNVWFGRIFWTCSLMSFESEKK